MQPRVDSAPRRRRPTHRHGRRAPATLVVGGVVLGASLIGAVLAATGPRPDQVDALTDRGEVAAGGHSLPETSDVPPARGPAVRAADVLRGWDERRAAAYSRGDLAALRDLYVDGVGVADVRLLRRYVDRGYRVEGMATQLLAVQVLGRAPGRWLLRVTDRLSGAVAVRGEERVRLPRDRADTHVVTVVHADGEWRVARIRTDRAR